MYKCQIYVCINIVNILITIKTFTSGNMTKTKLFFLNLKSKIFKLCADKSYRIFS